MKVSILVKFAALLAVFGLVPIGVTALTTSAASNAYEEGMGLRLVSEGTTIAQKIDRTMAERYREVQVFAGNHALHDELDWYQLEGALVDALNESVQSSGAPYLTIVVDLDGRVVAVNNQDASGRPINTGELYSKDYSGAKWFRDLSSGQATTSFKYTSGSNQSASGTAVEALHVDPDVKAVYPQSSGYTLGFSAPVYLDGKVVAYMSNRIRFSIVEELFKTQYAKLKSQGYGDTELTLLDLEGNVIVDYDPAKNGSEEIKHDPAIIGKFNLAAKGVEAAQKAVAGSTGWLVSYHARKKIDQIAGHTPLVGADGHPGMPWAVLVRVPYEQAMATMAGMRTNALLALVLSAAVMFIFSMLFLRHTLRPLHDIVGIAKGLAKGDIDQEVKVSGDDEVGQVGKALGDALGYFRELAGEADALARGDLDLTIVTRSDKDILSARFSEVAKAQRFLVEETSRLIESTKAGQLNARGDASAVQGAYSDVIRGINELMEEVAAPIGEARSVLEQLANNDLRGRMSGEYRGEYESIKVAMNQAMDQLETAMSKVLTASGQVSTAASEITTGNQSIAQSASEQAATVEGIAKNLTEITTASKQSSEKAAAAREMVETAGNNASDGAQSMEQLSSAVERIKRSADETSKIVKTIDEIAFQTNLLALNAAVEAARAGDAGRGFAVVAEEVRGLALRSAEAAKTTAKMIQESVKSAEDGVALNRIVTESFGTISAQVQQVADAMVDIESNVEQQSAGVSRIDNSLSEMSTVTQQNAATTQETASATEELASQARAMQDQASAFSINDGAAHRSLEAVQSVPMAMAANDQSQQHAIPFDDDAVLERF